MKFYIKLRRHALLSWLLKHFIRRTTHYRCPADSFKPQPASQITLKHNEWLCWGLVVKQGSRGRTKTHKTHINESVRVQHSWQIQLQNVQSLPAFVHRHNNRIQLASITGRKATPLREKAESDQINGTYRRKTTGCPPAVHFLVSSVSSLKGSCCCLTLVTQ